MLAALDHDGIVATSPTGPCPDGRSWLADGVARGREPRRRASSAGRQRGGDRDARRRGRPRPRGGASRAASCTATSSPGTSSWSAVRIDAGEGARLRPARPVLAASDPPRPGTMLGTPGYMAPEQARGERRDRRARRRVLARLRPLQVPTGAAPFEGEDILAVLLKIVLEEAPRVGELGPASPRRSTISSRGCSRSHPTSAPRDGASVAGGPARHRSGLTATAPAGRARRRRPSPRSSGGWSVSSWLTGNAPCVDPRR